MIKSFIGRLVRSGIRAASLSVFAAAALTAAGTAAAGPEVGTRVPPFVGIDHTGAKQDMNGLAGENGLLLLFFRSADW